MTESADDKSAPSATERVLLAPGAMLRRARADAGLSHEQVGQKLHLSTRQLLALEHDDYSILPGPTYVRGYLRAYADLIGLEPKTVLAAHSQLAPMAPLPDFHAIAPEREMTSGHHHIQTITWGVVAAIVGLSFAWWLGSESGGPVIEPAAVGVPLGSATTAAAMNLTSLSAELLEGMPRDASAVPATTEPVADIAGIINMRIPPLTIDQPALTVAPITPESALATVPVTPIATVMGLVVRTTQEAWLDVRDAKGSKLLYDMVPAGRTIRLEGSTPIEVFIGNANGVQVDWNGEPVDILRYQRGRTARFNVGQR